MGEPAQAAERRRGEEGAARVEAGGVQLLLALVEHAVDPRRERRALDRAPPVALDEHEQDVLAAQAGEELVAGRVAEGSWASWRASTERSCRSAWTDCTSSTASAAALEEATGAPATRRITHSTPSTAAARSAQPRWPAATFVTRSSASTGIARIATDEHHRTHDGEVGGGLPGRVAQRLDADARVARVVDRPERPVEGGEEADVEHLHDDQHAQHRSRDDGQHASRRGGQQRGHRDDDEELEREPREPAEVEAVGPVGRDERGPDQQQGEGAERHGDTTARGPRGAAAPQPPGALRHRGGERDERDGEEDLGGRARQDARGRDGQHDALRRRHRTAPAAPRQRRAHPRQQPLAGQERVAREADGEHPRAVLAGGVDAEREDQEGVDLAVEARAQRGRGAGAARHPAVGGVERERDGRERHQQRDRRGVRERVGRQRGDADRERGAGERHPRRRAEPLAARAGERGRHDRGAGEADDLTRGAEAGRGRQHGEQQRRGEQRRRRARPAARPERRGGHASSNRGESA